jgi:hypothetical protein
MEKVKVKSVKDSGIISQTGSPIISVTLEDGRSGSAYTKDALGWEGEIELEVKPAKATSSGQQYYNFFVPKESNKKSFPQKDYKFEKRNSSLGLAINWVGIKNPTESSTSNVLLIAEKFYEYLNS